MAADDGMPAALASPLTSARPFPFRKHSAVSALGDIPRSWAMAFAVSDDYE
jgi:hypothetical protein